MIFFYLMLSYLGDKDNNYNSIWVFFQKLKTSSNFLFLKLLFILYAQWPIQLGLFIIIGNVILYYDIKLIHLMKLCPEWLNYFCLSENPAFFNTRFQQEETVELLTTH